MTFWDEKEAKGLFEEQPFYMLQLKNSTLNVLITFFS